MELKLIRSTDCSNVTWKLSSSEMPTMIDLHNIHFYFNQYLFYDMWRFLVVIVRRHFICRRPSSGPGAVLSILDMLSRTKHIANDSSHELWYWQWDHHSSQSTQLHGLNWKNWIEIGRLVWEFWVLDPNDRDNMEQELYKFISEPNTDERSNSYHWWALSQVAHPPIARQYLHAYL